LQEIAGRDIGLMQQGQEEKETGEQREVSPCSEDGVSGLSGGLGTQLGELFEHLTADMVNDGLLPAAKVAAAAKAASALTNRSSSSNGGFIKAGKGLQEGAAAAVAAAEVAAAAVDDSAAAAAGMGEDEGDMHAALDTAALFALAGGESD
jgi:hypothetical protein